MQYQPFVSLVPWTIIIQSANLLILTAILGKLLFRPVQKILNLRKMEVEGIYSAAGQEKQATQELRYEYAERLKNAGAEANEMKKQAEKEIEKMAANIIERAEGEAAHIRESAKRRMDQDRRRTAEQLRAESSRLAVEAAEKLLQREINDADQQRLLEEFMESAEFGL